MKRKHIVWIAVCFALVLAACQIQARQPVTLRLGLFAGSSWDVPGSRASQVLEEAIARFEKNHPGVQVEYQSGIRRAEYSDWLFDQLAEGTEPDLFLIPSEDLDALHSLHALMDLTCFTRTDPGFSAAAFYPTLYEAGQFDGRQYALPYECDPTFMFVNRTLLEKEKIDLPASEWTIDDFFAICQRVTKDTDGDGQPDQFGALNYTWTDILHTASHAVFDAAGTSCDVSSAQVAEAVAFQKKLQDLSGSIRISSREFDAGHVAFAPMKLSAYRTYKPYPWKIKKYSTFEWDCVRMPALSGERGVTDVSLMSMGISARSPHGALAWSLLSELCVSEETQQALSMASQGISPLVSVARSEAVRSSLREEAGDSSVNLDLLEEMLESIWYTPRFQKYEAAMSLLDSGISAGLENGEDPGQFLSELQQQVDLFLTQ